MFWTLNRLVEPVTVLSVRVTQGYMAAEEPRFGNRLMVHALVKFDTEQVRTFKLCIYRSPDIDVRLSFFSELGDIR